MADTNRIVDLGCMCIALHKILFCICSDKKIRTSI